MILLISICLNLLVPNWGRKEVLHLLCPPNPTKSMGTKLERVFSDRLSLKLLLFFDIELYELFAYFGN